MRQDSQATIPSDSQQSDDTDAIFDTELGLQAIIEKNKAKLEEALTCRPPFEYKNHETFESRLNQFVFEQKDPEALENNALIEILINAKRFDDCDWLLTVGLSDKRLAIKAAESGQTLYAEKIRVKYALLPADLLTNELARKNPKYVTQLQILHLLAFASCYLDISRSYSSWVWLAIPPVCQNMSNETKTKAENALALTKHLGLSQSQASHIVSEGLLNAIHLLPAIFNPKHATGHGGRKIKSSPFDLNIWTIIFSYLFGLPDHLETGAPKYVKSADLQAKLPLFQLAKFFRDMTTQDAQQTTGATAERRQRLQ